MNLRKILIISFFILTILLIGSVSANDVNSDDLTNIDNNDSIISDVESEIDNIKEDNLEDDDLSSDDDEEEIMVVEWPENITYDNYKSFKINLPEDATGDLKLFVNEIEVEQTEVGYNNEYYLGYNAIQMGISNFTITYSGDDNYQPVSISKIYNISDYTINIYPDYVFGESEYISITAPYNFTSNLTITINGKEYEVEYNRNNYRYELKVENFNYGENDINIYYQGDSIFKEYNSTKTINTYSTIHIPDTVEYNGNSYVYLVLPSDVTGTLTVYENYLDEENRKELGSSNVENGYVSVPLSFESLGEHNIYASFIGSVTLSDSETVVTVNPKITVPVVIVGGDYNLTVEVPEDVSGDLKLFINTDYGDYEEYKSASVENGFASISLSDLSMNTYDIRISFDDDYEKYGTLYVVNNTNFNITINGLENNSDVLMNNAFYFDIGLPGYAKGNITVFIDGEIYTKITTDDFYSWVDINTKNLAIGNHTLKVIFESDLFDNSTDSIIFNVVPIKARIPEKIVVDYDNGDSEYAYIYIVASDDITGNIIVLLNDEVYRNLTLGNHQSDWELFLNNIALKNYTVNIIYSGDDNYPKYEITRLCNLTYNIDTYYEDNNGDIEFYIGLPYNIGNGYLTVTIDNKEYDWNYSGNYNYVKVNISDLTSGKHEVIVNYSGDDKYYPLEVSKNISISKNDLVEIYRNSEFISFTLPSDATGNLTLNISSIEFDEDGDIIKSIEVVNITLVNGVANYSFSKLSKSYYIIEYTYDGSDYNITSDYILVSLIPDITVDYVDFDFEGNDLKLDGSILISFASYYSGKVVVKVNNLTYAYSDYDDYYDHDETRPTWSYDEATYYYDTIKSTNITLSDGKTNYTISDLNLGRYMISIEYYIDDEKIFSKKYGILHVVPIEVNIEETLIYNQSNNFSLVLPSNANGTFSVEIHSDDEDSTLIKSLSETTFVDGKVLVNLPNLDLGRYYAIINYSGNYGEYNLYHYFDVKPEFIVPNIQTDGNNIITYKLAGANGNLTIYEDDVKYDTVSIVDGVANITLPNILKENNYYTFIFEYIGDDGNQSNSTLYIHTNLNPAISVSVNNQTQNMSYNIKLPVFANGTITLTIGDNKYETSVINGFATINTDLAIGKYNITVDYDGNDRYNRIVKLFNSSQLGIDESNNGDSNNTNASGNNTTNTNGTNTTGNGTNATSNNTTVVEPKITGNKNIAMYYQDGSAYKVRVYGNDGNVASGVTVKFTINGKTYKVKTDKKGYASLVITNIPKKYTITAQYGAAKVSNTVTVKQILTLNSVVVKKSAKKLTLTATLKKVNGKYLKSKTITFKFNGKTYKAKTNSKGVVKVTVKKAVLKKLKVGKKITYQATYLKDTVSKTVKVKK